MTKHWVVAAIGAFGWALALCAAGDSADFLLTPEKISGGEIVPNTGKGIKLGSASDPKREARDGWYGVDGTSYCMARAGGVGLRKNGGSTLRKDFAEPERVAYVAVTCRTQSKSNLGKEASLSLRLADDEPAQTQTFETPAAVEASVTVTFRFDPAVEADCLALSSGADCGVIFEVARVIWEAEAPELAATFSVPEDVLAGETFLCALATLEGGAGEYARVTWRFEGQERTLLAAAGDDLMEAVAFTAPYTDGDTSVTVEVEDAAGTVKTWACPLHITPYAPPRDVTVRDVTRTGFRLTWEMPATGLTPVAYTIRVIDELYGTTGEALAAPAWLQEAETRWVVGEVWDLSAAAAGMACATCFLETDPAWKGVLSVRLAGEADWKPLVNIGGMHLGFDLPAAERVALELRAEGEEPPAWVRAQLPRVGNVYCDVALPTDAQRRDYTVTGLPPGRTVVVTLGAQCELNDGRRVTSNADAIAVTLEALPTLGLSADTRFEQVYFQWPEGAAEAGHTATVSFHAEVALPQATPPGLYLTRVYLTDKSAGGTGKAIALTNTTDATISLDGNRYTLLATNTESAKTSEWDFHLTDDETGDWVYPITVPARGEVVIAHTRYQPLEMRAGVYLYGGPALNFTPAYTLTLLRDGAPVNSLAPVQNAIVRQPGDDLAAAPVATPVLSGMTTLSMLYDPWTRFTETRQLQARIYTPDDSYEGYGNLLDILPADATRLWVRAILHDGGADSAAATLTLWEKQPLVRDERPGFRLILR